MRISHAGLAWIAALALAGATPAWAKLYKWVDADGNVSYSERKPPDASAEEVQVRGTGLSDDEARRRLDALQEATEARREEREFERSHATASRDREERMRKNCEVARENLRILATNSRVKDESGDAPYYLSPEQIQKRTDQATANVEKYCE